MLLFCLLQTTAQAAMPALVTQTTGTVEVLDEGKTAEAPGVPFLLSGSTRLKVSKDGHVVLLVAGAARKVNGPAVVGLDDLSGSASSTGSGASVLEELVSRTTSTQRAGAHRGNFALQRPVPTSEVEALQEIRWACKPACEEVEVQVYDFLTDAVVWSGKGAGTVTYDGPTLQEQPYSLVIGGEDFAFSVKPIDEALKTAMTSVSVADADASTTAAVQAALWWKADRPSEALWTLDAAVKAQPDDTGLQSLRSHYDQQAGTAP